jgi:carbon-monoxide dehydrogenase medium subunit
LKFPPFDYVFPACLEEVFAVLSGDDEARVLAGGQSLLPLMALRLARPSVLVELEPLGFDQVEVAAGGLRLGAMARQAALEDSPSVLAHAPLLAEAVRHVGHRATRVRGTLGGSLAHADPAAELPAALVALGASVVVASAGGERSVLCSELAVGPFQTRLGPAEVLTRIDVPAAGDASGAWCEWAPRVGDFADAGIAIALSWSGDGVCIRVGAAACGVAPLPVDLTSVLAPLVAGVRRADPVLLREPRPPRSWRGCWRRGPCTAV